MKRKSLFFSFFTALSLLIAIPMVIITSILSYQVMRYSENEISKSYIGKLKVANNFIEMIAQYTYLEALKITMDGFVEEVNGIYIYNQIFENTDNIMVAYKIQESIINLAQANDMLHSVYLFPDSADYLITSNQGVVKLNEFKDTEWLDEYNNFRAYNSEQPSWLPTRLVSYSQDVEGQPSNTSNVITFFYVFTPYTTNVKGALIFNIHEKKLRDQINSSSSINEGHIIIVNSDGYTISHINEELVGRKFGEDYLAGIKESPDTEGYIISRTGGDSQLVTYYKSEFNDWIYIGVFPIDVLRGKVNGLIINTVYICLFFVVLGIMVSFFVSKKISSPLKKLADDIRTKRGIDITSTDSEMAILSKAFERIFKEEDKLFKIMENSRNSNRNNYLMNLLQGKTTEGLSSELTGIDFNCDSFICAVIHIDRYHEFTISYSREQQEYMKTLIMKVSEQLLGRDYKCAGVAVQKQRIAFIINFSSDENDKIEKKLQNIFLKIQGQMSKILDNTISIGVGNMRQEASGAAESYDRAQESLKYKFIYGNGSINFWKDVYISEATYYYPYSKEKHIFNLINSGISDKIEETVTELISEIREQKSMHYENIIQIILQLVINTVKMLLDQQLNISMIFGSNYNIYSILSSKETLDDVRDWLIEMFTQITHYLTGTKNLNKNYFDRALSYIHENYMKDIDINIIAKNAGISYSHLRKIFKEETGDNIINYINHIRIDEAKRLLCQSCMTIRSIALELGYNNEQSFARFFKKYENISPGEFRMSKKGLLSE